MSYIVTKEFLDRFDNMRHCKVGEVHEPINVERAKVLLDGGYIEPVESGGDDLEDGLKKLSGGFFELPNGEKVKGKAKALEVLKALQGGEGNESGEVGQENNLPE